MGLSEAVYRELKDMGLARSQYDYSRDFLAQSQAYYSSLKARGMEPSTTAMLALYIRLDDILGRINEADISSLKPEAERLERLCQSVWTELQDRVPGSIHAPFSGFTRQ